MDSQDRAHWRAILFLAILSVFFHLFMEWLFFATKFSFLSGIPVWHRITVLAASPLIPTLLVVFLILLMKGLGFFLRTQIYVVRVLPAFVLASSFLILIDNFTITIFRFGIKSSEGAVRAGYAVLFCGLLFMCYRLVRAWEEQLASRIPARVLAIGSCGLVGFFLVGTVLSYASGQPYEQESFPQLKALQQMPNILIIGGDGISADHTSVYGYERDTTPFLRKFSKEALVCDNAYANAASSYVSILSILTGKLPTQSRVMTSEDILMGRHSYQHLPGILRRLGYRSLQISVRKFADAFDSNMQNAFDSVNARTENQQKIFLGIGAIAGQETAYFLKQAYQRWTDRFFHVFGLQNMEDPFGEVTHQKKESMKDTAKLRRLFAFIEASDKPFFAQLHLMGTHRKFYKPKVQVFSAGERQTQEYMTDFYDDAIRTTDRHLNRVITFLRKTNRLENTIVVIYSDHGQKHYTNVRVPLIFRFPRRVYRGHLQVNAQNVDIAPTLLDYLKIPRLQWMDGQSLISKNLDRCPKILSVISSTNPDGDVEESFFANGLLWIILCDNYYVMNVGTKTLESGKLKSHAGGCPNCSVPGSPDMVQFVIAHLRRNGYDTEELEKGFKKQMRTPLADQFTIDASAVSQQPSPSRVH